MLQRAKKRGRPPGRRAPPTPVLSQRVPQELYDMIKDAARTAGRTMGEEMVWRVTRSFEWEAAFKDIPALQAEARKNIAQELQAAMRAGGYKPVRGMNGTAWFEPGVDTIAWIFDNSNRDVLEDLLARAAAHGIKLAQGGEKS
jgi:hypothetical protein